MTTLIKPFTKSASYLIATIALAYAGVSAAFGATLEQDGYDRSAIVPKHNIAPMPASYQPLLSQWIAFWNGDLSLAKSIIAPDFALHATLLDGRPDTAINGPNGLSSWVAQSHGFFSDLHFTVQVGPIVDGDFAVIRWVAESRYRGSIPGANAPVGTPLRFTGTDILRIEGGKIKDYWLNADTGDLMMQLKTGEKPVQR